MRWIIALICTVVLAVGFAARPGARRCNGHAQPDHFQWSISLLLREVWVAPSAMLRIADSEE